MLAAFSEMSQLKSLKNLKLGTEGIFIRNSKLFSQIGGVAMDNSLGSMVADWFLGMIEIKIFNQHLLFISSFYVHYVDNAFAIFNSSADAQLP